MKPVNFNNIQKIGTDENRIDAKKTIKKGSSKFDEILNSELDETAEMSKSKVDNIMPNTHILNIKNLSGEKIFIEKGLELCSEVNKIFSNIAENLKNNKNIKGLISNLSNTVNELSKISNNIEQPDAKNLIDKTIFTSNIEIEKYIRGDYS